MSKLPTSTKAMEVTFETKCWEKDWQLVLEPNRLKDSIENNSYAFKEKIVYINNVNNLDLVKKQAQKMVDLGIITKFVVVEDYAQETLNFFGIDKNDFLGGYYYSIQELVGIYLCKTPYLLHYSGDAMPTKPVDWINQAIKIIKSNSKVCCVNLISQNKEYQVKRESFDKDDNFYYNYGFSDQNYLVPVKLFRAKIYKEKNNASKRYPGYGGELFEKRVDSWMRNHNLFRATYKYGTYTHKNFESKTLGHKIKQLPRRSLQAYRFIFKRR